MAKKIIKLTESKLKKIIKETVDNIINRELRIEDFFDISKLDKQKILSIASDMRAFLQSQGYGSPLSVEGELLYESEIKTVPIKQLRSELLKLGFKQWQIKSTIIANQVRVVILYADLAKNTEVITNEMLSLGWTRARISSPQIIQGISCRVMDFDPLEQKTKTKEARKFSYLYHWTPECNVASLLKTGIEPRSDNDFLSYPPKAHLMKGNISPQDAAFLGWQLYNKNMHLKKGIIL